MSLNCLSGLFFILDHLIIKGCKLPNLFNCCLPWRRTSTEAWQFKFVSEREDEALLTQRGRYFYKVCLFCFVFYRDGVVISGHLSDRISACFISFFANIAKNVKKKGKLKGNLYQTSEKCALVLVIGQKRKRSGIKIRLLRLVSHSLGDVFKVPHAWSTVFSTFPFEKVSSNLECGAFDLF